MTPCDITYTVDVIMYNQQKTSHLAKHLEANKDDELLIWLFQQKPKGAVYNCESRGQELLQYTGYMGICLCEGYGFQAV